MELNVLAVGDVVSQAGLDFLERRLPRLKRELGVHFTVVNGENAAGIGLLPRQAEAILDSGADVVTLGNHTWSKLQIADYLDDAPCVLRPANFSQRLPGRGYGVFDGPRGLRIGVMNLIGRVELNPNAENPFTTADRLLAQERCRHRARGFPRRGHQRKAGHWAGIWTAGSAPFGAPTPMCPRRTGRSFQKAPAMSPIWA